jgi:hypothetical protein
MRAAPQACASHAVDTPGIDHCDVSCYKCNLKAIGSVNVCFRMYHELSYVL